MYSFGLSVFFPSGAVGKVDIFKVDKTFGSKVMAVGRGPDYTSRIRSTYFCGGKDVWKKKFGEDKVTDNVGSLRISNHFWKKVPIAIRSLEQFYCLGEESSRR